MSTPSATKFFQLLQTMEPAEVKAFDLWLQSRWCNTNKNLVRLLARVMQYYPAFTDPKLTKERLFRQVLPDGKFSERRMNNLLSEAYLAGERFLVFQRFAGNHELQQMLLAQEFQGRALDDWFFRHAHREIGRLEARTVKDWKYHLNLLRLHRRIYQHPSQGPRLQSGQATLVQMNTQVDLLYVLEKAAVINEMIARSRLFKGEQYDVPAELIKWRAAAEGIQHPALDLYRLRFAYTPAERLPQYAQLQTALLERFDSLNEREQKTQLLSLLNDAKQLIKSGQLDITATLPLYQLGLATGAIFNQGKLTANTYTTIVTASNTKGAFDFTTHFIDTYTPCLATTTQADCAHWARAHTAYWQKDPAGCLAILQGYDFQSPNFELIGRVLTTQAYFDLYLQDPSYEMYLFNFFDTFEKWLTREKLWSKSSHLAFLRFVQACRTLARHYAEVDPKPEKLNGLLEKGAHIQALNWLQQKRVDVLQLKAKRPSRF